MFGLISAAHHFQIRCKDKPVYIINQIFFEKKFWVLIKKVEKACLSGLQAHFSPNFFCAIRIVTFACL